MFSTHNSPAGFRGIFPHQVIFSGVIEPSITANQDNWNPTGLSAASTIRASTDASRTITGLAGGADAVWPASVTDGRLILLLNVGSNPLVLADESASSTAANRFALPSSANLTLAPECSVLLQYDRTASRWRVLGDVHGGSGVAVGDSPTWTGTHTWNPGTSPATPMVLDIAAIGSAGTRDSHAMQWTGRSDDGSAHAVNWKAFVDVTSNAGESTFTVQSRVDAGGFTNRFRVTDAGALLASSMVLSGTIEAGATGFQVDAGGGVGCTSLNTGAANCTSLTVTGGSLGTVFHTLQTTGGPIEETLQNEVATTNDTPTVLHTFTIPANTTVGIIAHVVARRTGGVSGTAEDGGYYQVQGAFKLVAGAAVIIGQVAMFQESDFIGDQVVFEADSNTIRLRVTGPADNNIVWHATVRVSKVST